MSLESLGGWLRWIFGRRTTRVGRGRRPRRKPTWARAVRDRPLIKTAADVHALFAGLGRVGQERLYVLCLTDQRILCRVVCVGVGTASTLITHPREVFHPAILARASFIILVHNHPNGDARPSVEDIQLTVQLHAAGMILGIQVVDHVIIGSTDYTSLKERGEIPAPDEATRSPVFHH